MKDKAQQSVHHSHAEEPDQRNLVDLAAELFGEHGIELEPHPPVPVREAPDFGR
jgi:hypothetical protein